MSQHAILSPSGAECWMNCAGSAAMQKGLPDTANEYSDEGTAAHLLLSDCLEHGTNAADSLGRRIHVGANDDFDGAVWDYEDPRTGFVVRRTYTVDDDMAEHVQKVADTIREYTKGGLMFAERRIGISPFTGEEGAEGTADATGILPRELQMHDLKFGMGVRVSAIKNKQLMLYTLGVREELDLAYGPFDRFRMVIHQPRLDHLSEWDCTAEELDAFAEEVKARADLALGLYNEGLVGTGHEQAEGLYLLPSEDACRWCKAKPTCPALAKFVEDSAAADFGAISPDPAVVRVPMENFSPELLARKLAAVPLIEDWCKAIRAKVESELFAGVAIPGWKIVQGKKGNRSWVDEEKVDALLRKMRLKTEERCNLKLKSPTQIEKFLKATPKRLQRLNDAGLIGQKEGQPSVAPESDPRPVWTPPDTAADFSPVEESIT